jgi:DNA-binding response OmpR family regulator
MVMGRILIVDDQVESCRPLAVLVRYLGHKGDYATSGLAALDYLGKYLPDLLILDVMMPGMDGMEVLQRLRADSRYAGMPVVMFSALDEDAVRRHALELGASDYWIKASMGFDELGERLQKMLGDRTVPECQLPQDQDKGDGIGMANA